MSHNHRLVLLSRISGTVLTESGKRLTPPEDWAFLPAGDAAITRSVKTKGVTWVVQIRKGRRSISKGIWANKTDIEESKKEVLTKRSTPEYNRKREKDLSRRTEKHKKYVTEFSAEVMRFLDFHSKYQQEASRLAERVTTHATPVGSGTVARTKRLPLASRAEAAVIAWMRHQTTAYDSMKIAKIKGRRREIRRQFALKSIQILQAYRQGREIGENCPLKRALEKTTL